MFAHDSAWVSAYENQVWGGFIQGFPVHSIRRSQQLVPRRVDPPRHKLKGVRYRDEKPRCNRVRGGVQQQEEEEASTTDKPYLKYIQLWQASQHPRKARAAKWLWVRRHFS